MSNQTIWITGASSGIGAAAAKLYNAKGYRVILSARNEKALVEVQESFEHPENSFVLPLDLEDQSSFQQKTKEAIAAFGRIDIMLHNGGISQRSLVTETILEVDRKLMEINFFGTIALTKELLPYFIQNGSGQFGVVSSLVGKFGTQYRSSYSASKHALHGFFESLRAENHNDGIAVTLICPGFIRTNVSINALTGDGSALNKMDQAQAKGMSPEDCAEAIYKALKSKKEEVYIGGKETFAVYAKRYFPSFFSKILRKSNVR